MGKWIQFPLKMLSYFAEKKSWRTSGETLKVIPKKKILENFLEGLLENP